MKRRFENGRLFIILAAPILSVPVGYLFITTESVVTAYVCSFFFSMFSPMWTGPAASTLNDLVLPRMRALASAFYIMMITFIGLALGPYLIGFVSDSLVNSGAESGAALQGAMIYALGMFGLATIFILAAFYFLPNDEATRQARAQAAGEAGPD